MLTVGESLSAKAPKVSHFRLTLCSCSDRCPVVLDWLGVGESAGRSFSTAAPISAAHWSRSSREHASRKYSAELLVCSLNTSWGTVNNKEDQRMMLNSWRLHLNPKMISWCVQQHREMYRTHLWKLWKAHCIYDDSVKWSKVETTLNLKKMIFMTGCPRALHSLVWFQQEAKSWAGLNRGETLPLRSLFSTIQHVIYEHI